MEDERILTGYCRCIDQSRIVTVELEGCKWYADCSYGNCPYEASCGIARQIRETEA